VAVLDCVVVGGGPAGLVAGLYLRRFHRQVRIVDAGTGRARRIARSHNVAGFPDGISGVQLLERMRRHLAQVGGEVMAGTVQALHRTAQGLFAVVIGEQTLWARRVILCTGVKDRLPAIEGAAAVDAADLMRYCPVCDGYEHTGKRIGVLGRTVHGVREAGFLRGFSEDVGFIDVDGEPDALQPPLQAAGVTPVAGRPVRLAVGDTGQVLVTADDGQVHRFDVVYAALGVDPCVELAAGLGARLDENANLVTDAHGRTSVEHLYAAGDVVRALDQIGVAVGQAAIAATAVHNSLRA
jgi:thioredoxin reductase (NADPH)